MKFDNKFPKSVLGTVWNGCWWLTRRRSLKDVANDRNPSPTVNGPSEIAEIFKEKKKQIQQVWGDTFCYSRRRRPLLVSGAWLQQQLISYLLLLEKYRNVGLYLSSGSARSQAFRHVGRRTDELPAPSHLQVIFFLFSILLPTRKRWERKSAHLEWNPCAAKPWSCCFGQGKYLLRQRDGCLMHSPDGRYIFFFFRNWDCRSPVFRQSRCGIPFELSRLFLLLVRFFFVCCVDSPKGATVHQPFI